MRTFLCALVLAVMVGMVAPAHAQLKKEVPKQRAPVKVLDNDQESFSLASLLSPEQFRMGHSYQVAISAAGGQTFSFGEYTNTMYLEFSDELAARADVALMHDPFGLNQNLGATGLNQFMRNVYLKNAEVTYRPSENLQFNVAYRQSKYGGYMSPYGRYGHGYGHPYGAYDRNSFHNGFNVSIGAYRGPWGPWR